MTRTIKRELCKLSKSDKRYLLDNMNYRHRLYNKGIELIRLAKTKFPDQHINTYDVNHLLYHTYEKTLSNYDYYCKGIREIVARDLGRMLNDVYSNQLYYNSIEERFRFKPFSINHRSFGFKTKVYKYKDHYIGAVKEIDDDYIKISFGEGNIRTFYIKEKSWYNKNHPYYFEWNNIKEIVFTFINGKFFISLKITDMIMPNRYSKKDDRIKLAGIDLGERNPVVVYDKNGYTKIKFPDNRIKKLNKRIDSYRKILSRKTRGSNNYNKILLRMSKLYRKQLNIRLDWRNKVAYEIANTYKNIIVDEFSVPIINVGDKEFKGKRRKYINRVILDRGIGYLVQTLPAMCEKYHCEYIKASPNTTRTCSKCGYVNEPLPLSERKLKCDKCGEVIDRDENAALNCYNQFKPYIITI